MVDLNLANFLARNRQAGGVNAQLADALSANFAPRSAGLAPSPSVTPGMFGIGRGTGTAERPRPPGGDALTLAGMLTGGATFPLTSIGALVTNDAMGNAPSLSFVDAFSRGDRDRPDRGRVSRPDRTRSASNREAGGGFVE